MLGDVVGPIAFSYNGDFPSAGFENLLAHLLETVEPLAETTYQSRKEFTTIREEKFLLLGRGVAVSFFGPRCGLGVAKELVTPVPPAKTSKQNHNTLRGALARAPTAEKWPSTRVDS